MSEGELLTGDGVTLGIVRIGDTVRRPLRPFSLTVQAYLAHLRAAGITGAPRHSFVSILSTHGVRIEDISDLVGHSGTSVTECVYRHEIRPAFTTGATAMNTILSKKRARSA